MDFLGLRHLKQSLTCAFRGLKEACHEVAFRQELLIGAIALPCAWLVPGLTPLWRVFLSICWLALPTIEIVNTSVENAVNLASPEFHPLARKAKDLAGAAVLCVCFGNFFVWSCAIYKVVKYFLAK